MLYKTFIKYMYLFQFSLFTLLTDKSKKKNAEIIRKPWTISREIEQSHN